MHLCKNEMSYFIFQSFTYKKLALDLVKSWIQFICFPSFDGIPETKIQMCHILRIKFDLDKILQKHVR